MKELTFITSNAVKAAKLSDYLKRPVSHRAIELVEIQSLEIEEITTHKAREAFRIVQAPVLVNDYSLQINALGKLPGPLVKWFLEEIGPQGICDLVERYADKSAVARTAFGYCDDDRVEVFLGERHGRIVEKASEKCEWGTDGIFIPNGYDRPWSEMSQPELDATSIRRIALEKLDTFLRSSE